MRIIMQVVPCVFLMVMLSTFAAAEGTIGLGASPSKKTYTVQGGQVIEDTYLFYNTGSKTLTARVYAEGDIGEFVVIEPDLVTIEPEPQPHTLPIKNGKKVRVQYRVPPSLEEQHYKGNIVATGGTPTPEGTFGAMIAVAMRIEIVAAKTTNPLAFLTPTVAFMIGGGLVAVFFMLLFVQIMRQQKVRIRVVQAKKVPNPRK